MTTELLPVDLVMVTADDKTGPVDFISTVSVLSGMLDILVERQVRYRALGLDVGLK